MLQNCFIFERLEKLVMKILVLHKWLGIILLSYQHIDLNAVVVELVDTPDSKSGFERSDGSSPSSGTN